MASGWYHGHCGCCGVECDSNTEAIVTFVGVDAAACTACTKTGFNRSVRTTQLNLDGAYTLAWNSLFSTADICVYTAFIPEATANHERDFWTSSETCSGAPDLTRGAGIDILASVRRSDQTVRQISASSTTSSGSAKLFDALFAYEPLNTFIDNDHTTCAAQISSTGGQAKLQIQALP